MSLHVSEHMYVHALLCRACMSMSHACMSMSISS